MLLSLVAGLVVRTAGALALRAPRGAPLSAPSRLLRNSSRAPVVNASYPRMLGARDFVREEPLCGGERGLGSALQIVGGLDAGKLRGLD